MIPDMRKYFLGFLLIFLLASASQPALGANAAYTARITPLLPKTTAENNKLGVVVRSLTTGQTIFEHNSKKQFIPASNEKIITSVAALTLLEKDFRFKTDFFSGGGISKGVLHGGMYIKGYGDPTLSEGHLGYIVFELKKRGVKEIKGGIVVDESYFSPDRRAKGWKEEWKNDFYSPPIGALTYNYNVIEVKVRGAGTGQKPTATIIPSGSNISIVNQAVTSTKKSTLHTKWQGDESLVLQGSIRPKATIILKIPVKNPTLLTGNVIKNKLQESGIKVEGNVTAGTVPRWASRFYTHYSDPLSEVVTEYNKNSVNIIGENLIKTLGAEFKGTPGTWEKGSEVISTFLNQAGIENGFYIADGSGLSLDNRVTPEVLADVLSYAYSNRMISSEFLISLPVAGVDGTLKKRFKATEIQGRVKAKTGYLNNVRALSGYMFTKQGEVLVFSIISNGLGWKAKEFQNDLLETLVDCCGAEISTGSEKR